MHGYETEARLRYPDKFTVCKTLLLWIDFKLCSEDDLDDKFPINVNNAAFVKKWDFIFVQVRDRVYEKKLECIPLFGKGVNRDLIESSDVWLSPFDMAKSAMSIPFPRLVSFLSQRFTRPKKTIWCDFIKNMLR